MNRFDRQTAAAFGDTREFFGASIASISASAKARPTASANLKITGKAAVAPPVVKPTAKPGDARAAHALKAAAAAGPVAALPGSKPAAKPSTASVISLANSIGKGVQTAVVKATSAKLDAKSTLAGKVTATVKTPALVVKAAAAPALKAPAVKAPAVKAAPKPVQPPKPLSAAELAQADADFAANMGKTSTAKPSAAALAKAKEVSPAARAAELKAKAAATASINAKPGGYNDQRAEEHARQMADNNRIAQGPAGKAGVDLGLIPMGIKVLATGAAVIATGGALAGGIGLAAGGGTLAAAGAADQLVAAVERGGAIAKDAKAAINTVKDAAKKGDAAAKAAVKVIAEVTDERKLKGIASGVVQDLTAQGKAAVNGVAGSLLGGLDVNKVIAAANAPGAAKPTATLDVSSTFSKAQKDGKITVTKRPNALIDAIVPPSKLWLVTDGGKVINLEAQPSSASSRGWAVYSNGKVVHQ